ncbi:hypothetical protein Dsin_032279 [Dipteronia sinensis]|uniref:RING-type domain-containing protein n=1 Tax=Dipteronia sinensis TaxID=43782 RepID=A0AAD9ZNH4_9ROSI|nr:hypothetical protein Dsin_032279 [Dipteronia sinensis]
MVMILLILHWIGSASTYVVENLAQVVLTQEDLESNNAYCAVFRMRPVLRRKRSNHACSSVSWPHGHCIVPWLAFGSTCPVCHYKLPTDDVVYNMRTKELLLVCDGNLCSHEFEVFLLSSRFYKLKMLLWERGYLFILRIMRYLLVI